MANSALFSHEKFDLHEYNDVPLDQDIYLVDASFMDAYHQMMLSFFDGGQYDYQLCLVTPVAAKSVTEDSIELSWFINVVDRFHEVRVLLPRSAFYSCVGSWHTDEKPRIFVDSNWLNQLHARTYSIFAMVDAANVKEAMAKGVVNRERLVEIRRQIDELSAVYKDILFISFADSILLKSAWNPGNYPAGTKYRYNPEVFIEIGRKIDTIYRTVLGLKTYMVLAQGANEYYDDPLHHVSSSGNHISLNSLGSTFALLWDIEEAARSRTRDPGHGAFDLYMDSTYFRSLKFDHSFEKTQVAKFTYESKVASSQGEYFASDRDAVVENIQTLGGVGA